MPRLSETIREVRSGVFHVVCLDLADRPIGSGTAFMSKGCLVTNGHVFDTPPNTSRVWLRQDGHLTRDQGVCLRRKDFEKRRIVVSPSEEYDYAVLDVPELLSFNPHQFRIADHTTKDIGQKVAFLGYPLEHQNLTCHTGIISSYYVSGSVNVIQVDASVNPSNSGGPLFDPCTGETIGIVTRKATGLTKMFSELRDALQNNVRTIQAIGGDIQFGGMSITQALIAGQTQILATLSEIERSANVGIGYAFSCRHLLEEPLFSTRSP